jgi:hypothetical protein
MVVQIMHTLLFSQLEKDIKIASDDYGIGFSPSVLIYMF